jgi:ATP-dependent DNA helicase RecQ
MGDKFQALWSNPKFTTRLLNFVFDEAHCISRWGTFRNEYLKVGSLRYLIPERIPFYVTSATLPSAILHDLTDLLQLRHNQTEYILRSNERSDIALMVRSLVHSASTFEDLAFLVPNLKDWKEGDPLPPKFVIFFDDTKQAERATHYLRSLLPENLALKIRYFHATMTQSFRKDKTEDLRLGNAWGICATDAFGMVSVISVHER